MERPACTDPAHAGSHVVRAGLYGKPPHQRQRWKCSPLDGSDPHRFAEVLPRFVTPGHVCSECSTQVESWEGPPAPRLYGFSARHVAQALIWVSNGATFREAANQIRLTAGRPLSRGAALSKHADPNRHGQLISDWIEVFAPPIIDEFMPKIWAPRLMLDATKFTYRVKAKKVSATAFYVLGAAGYGPGAQQPRVWRLEAFKQETKAEWTQFLSGLDGSPELIVTDAGKAAGNAAFRVFPRPGGPLPVLRRCEWHLMQNITESYDSDIKKNPKHDIHAKQDGCLTSLDRWDEYETWVRTLAAKTGKLRKTIKWLDTNAGWITTHIDERTWQGPHSTGPLENVFRVLDKQLDDRAGTFTNKRRLDLLLGLMACRMNGTADERRWAEIIRDHAAATAGRPANQRQITDNIKHLSLR